MQTNTRFCWSIVEHYHVPTDGNRFVVALGRMEQPDRMVAGLLRSGHPFR